MMIRFAICLIVLLAALPQANGADHPRERLDMIIGDWTIEGREGSFSEVCQWFHNRSHVVCNSESKSNSGVSRGVSVFSYSETKERFVYYHYGSSGVAEGMDVFTDGRSLLATAERQAGSDLVREQVWMTPRPDGTFDFRIDVSKNGAPWETTTRFHYVRRTRPQE